MRSALLHQNTIAFIAVKNKLDNYIFVETKHVAADSPLAKFKTQVNNIDVSKLLRLFIAGQRSHSPCLLNFGCKDMNASVNEYF